MSNGYKTIYEKLICAVDEYDMIKRGCGVLVGFSGGADSVTLLTLLIELSRQRGFRVYAAHINHMLRGEEAERDMNFCIDFCKSRGIKLFVCKKDVNKISRELSLGIEETARRVRYEFFDEIISQNTDINKIATAHTASDNAETLLFNLARGAGLSGVCGIPPVRGNIVRPLIYVQKREVLEFCKEQNLDFVYDSTNGDDDFSRNYIRKDILPRFERLSENPEAKFSRVSALCRRDLDFISGVADGIYAQSESGGRLKISSIKENHRAISSRLIIKHYAKECGGTLEYVHVESILEKIMGGDTRFDISLPRGISAVTEFGFLSFVKSRAPDGDYEYPLSDGENRFEKENLFIYISHEADTDAKKPSDEIYKTITRISLCSDKIKGRLYVRNRRQGDCIVMSGVHRKLKKLMLEKKIPSHERDRLPLICDDDGIVYANRVAFRDLARYGGGGGNIDIFICEK